MEKCNLECYETPEEETLKINILSTETLETIRENM